MSRRSAATTLALATLALPACGGSDDDSASKSREDPNLVKIETPAEGGLAKSQDVEVRIRTAADAEDVQVVLDTKPVTERFGPPRDGVRSARLRLPRGVNRIYARARSGDREGFDSARFTVARRDRGMVSLGTPEAGSAPKVSLPRGASHVEAKLNGKPLKRSVLDGDQGAPDADDGLRHGANRLSVTAATSDGRYDTQSKSFSVARSRPLAGAGIPQRGQVGRKVKLNARGSRPSAQGGQLTYSWRVASSPDGSKPKLENPDSAQPQLVPDRPGRYAVQLRVSEAGKPAGPPDTVVVSAEPKIKPIGWRLATIPSGGGGIKLNGKVPTANGSSASGGNWIQLVVLERGTLKVKVARPINTNQASDLSQAIDDAKQSQQQGDDQLVVLTGAGKQTSLSSQQLSVLRSAWSTLGGTLKQFGPSKNQGPGFGSGQWSIVGTPGLSQGAAQQSYGIAAGEGQAAGGMSGLLEKDMNNLYSFVYDQYIPFDTAASGGQISVGGQTYSPQASDGENGFHLLALDPGSLNKIFEQTYVTAADGFTPKPAATTALAEKLDSLAGGRQALVVLQSVGSPQPLESTWTSKLSPAIAKLGGTQDVVNNLNGSGGYTLVANTRSPDRFATEQSQPMTGKPARITGVLSRNPRGQLGASYASPDSGYDFGLFETAYGPGKPFPAWPNATQERIYPVMSQLSEVGPQTDDLRANYWLNVSEQWTTSSVNDIKQNQVEAQLGQQVSTTDFNAVQSQLAQEILWVKEIRAWVGDVKSIYLTAGLPNSVTITKDASTILQNLNPPSTGSDVATQVIGTLSEALFVSTYFAAEAVAPEIGVIAGGLGIVAAIGTTTGESKGEPLSAAIETEARDLGSQLQQRYQQVSKQLPRLADILVSDYGKLETAGKAVQDQWSFDTDSENASGAALKKTTQRTIWKTLFPIAYRDDTLNPTNLNTDPKQARDYKCVVDEGNAGYTGKPYSSEPDGGQEYIRTGFKGKQRQSRLHAFGVKGGSPHDDGFRVPNSKVTDPLFSRDKENPLAAGFFKLEFFDRYPKSQQVHCEGGN